MRLLALVLVLTGCAGPPQMVPGADLNMGADVPTPEAYARLCAQRPKLVVCGGRGE